MGVVGLALFTGEMVLLPTARLVLADGAGRMEKGAALILLMSADVSGEARAEDAG